MTFFRSRTAFNAIHLPIFFFLFAGCSSSPVTTQEKPAVVEETRNQAVQRLRNDTTSSTCINVLRELNTFNQSKGTSLPRLKEAERDLIQRELNLTRDELAELERTDYSLLDGHYAAECMFFSEATKALETDRFAPEIQAKLTFDWVCRQMTVSAAVSGRPMPPAATQYSLRRGRGSGWDRACVFLAAVQQLKLDTCLIGPANAGQKKSFSVQKGSGDSLETLSPFWAVGVRAGTQIYLFDPWGGKPWPGPEGKGIATLAQTRSHPAMITSWLTEKVVADRWKESDFTQSEIYLSCPLSALCPRSQTLQTELNLIDRLRLRVDLISLRESLQKECLNGSPLAETKIHLYNPTGDLASPVRLLAHFLPVEEGGFDRNPAGERAYDLTQTSFLPTQLAPEFGLQHAQARLQAWGYFLDRMMQFSNATGPRDRMQRGRLGDAIKVLAKWRDESGQILAVQRLPEDELRGSLKAWVEEANDLYSDYQKAKDNKDDVTLGLIQPKMDSLWKRDTARRQILSQVTAELVNAESIYHLALCAQEKSERLQSKLDFGTADATTKVQAYENWENANSWWKQYLAQPANLIEVSPNRKQHAQRLADRASTALKSLEEKK
jgi:hypothetical protein